MKRLLSNKLYIAIFVAPALILFIAMGVVPLFITGYYGLFDYDGIGKKTFIGLQNYIDLFAADAYFLKSILNSFILAAGSLFVQLPIALLLAILLANGVKGEGFYRTVFFLPVVISSMVIGQLWCKIFNSDGLLNAILGFFGCTDDIAWLVNSKTAYMTTVIPAVWQSIGYHMVILYAGVKNISPEYYEAAKLDGATGFKAAMKITIPLLMPTIKVSATFALVGSLRVFDLVYVMTGGGPNHASEVPATLMYDNLFVKCRYGYGSAQAFFIVFECLLFSFLLNCIFKKSEENASAI
ncbi:MAG: sugar ABC transporter permease [Lachnospiraceae bacterium]|nr:sugar ABC transporter permease [Lachnospiraceae bacterium]